MAPFHTKSRSASEGSSGRRKSSESAKVKQARAVAEKAKDSGKPKDRLRQRVRLLGLSDAPEEAFVKLYEASALTQVALAKSLGAHDAKLILGQLRLPRGEALAALHIPAATMNRKVKMKAPLSPAEGERVLGFGRLLGQVQTIVRESGDPRGFNASKWLSIWMSSPVAALDGARPLDLMDTMTGQALVSQLISQMQSGAYA